MTSEIIQFPMNERAERDDIHMEPRGGRVYIEGLVPADIAKLLNSLLALHVQGQLVVTD